MSQFGCVLRRFGVFFQAEDGIRDLVRSRGLGDVYKRQVTGDRKMYIVASPVRQRMIHYVTGIIKRYNVIAPVL